jgi:hypothetical protein
VVEAGAPLSRSFSYANAGTTADRAMADAKAIVMIFTFGLRCLSKLSVLRARLVTQTRGALKASAHHKIRSFVHANVMVHPAQKRNRWQSITQRARLDEMTNHGALSFANNKVAMRQTRAT